MLKVAYCSNEYSMACKKTKRKTPETGTEEESLLSLQKENDSV